MTQHGKPWQPWRIRRSFDHAARQIMHHPETFDHACTTTPARNSSRVYEEGEIVPAAPKGSALGWLAHFFDEPGGAHHHKALEHIGTDEQTFLSRMDEISPQWRVSAHDCGAALLVYSSRYHADGAPEVSPSLEDNPKELQAGPKRTPLP